MISLTFVGRQGHFAGDDELNARTEHLVRQLMPLFEDIANAAGWDALLNALCTICVNAGVRMMGVEQTREAHEAILASLDKVQARAERDAKIGGNV